LEKLIHMATGLPASKEALRRKAAEIANMTREFNLREGLNPKAHDRLPKRLLTEALPSGAALSQEEMEQMLEEYYRLRAW
jgi:aldehyde:ferredoxin oxidoreductase